MGYENMDWRGAAASALDWWRDAGVDVLVEDAARNWLAASPPTPLSGGGRAPASSSSQLDPGVDLRSPSARRGGALPESWGEYLAWRSGPDAPEASLRGIAVTASGPADAALMVLADCPDQDDGASLLSGEAGRLFDRMLAAIGHKRADVHLAAVCARRPVAGRMPPELVERLHECARHHVGLVGPQRLLLFGNAASRALLATDVLPARGRLHFVNHADRKVMVVATHHPRALLRQPALKADAWRDLQLLMRDA